MVSSSKITIIGRDHRVTIPAALRQDLGLRPGQRLRWEKVGASELRLIVAEVPEPTGAQTMRGFAKRFREPRRSDEWMEILRGSR